MKWKFSPLAFVLLLWSVTNTFAQAWEYDNNRIAISADGNSAPDLQYKWPIGDPDDWGANAAILATLAKMEMQDQLVHYSYNNFIDAPAGPDSENQNKISCDGAIIRWHFDASNFFDITTQLEEAKNNLAREIVKSTAKDPLFFIHAGLSEFVYQAVEKAIEIGGLESLNHVKLISHSGFNEIEKRRSWHHTWDDIQELCGQRIQYYKIKDQNACGQPDILWCSGNDFSPWEWMSIHHDESVRWLYTRIQAHKTGKADISDVGMLYWLLTADEDGSPEKFKSFIGEGIPNAVQGISITKELDAHHKFILNAIQDFPVLNIPGFAPPYKDENRKAMAIDASQYQNSFAASKVELTAPAGFYDITLTSLTEIDGESTYRLMIDGEYIGESRNPMANKDYQVHTHTFKNVQLNDYSDIQVEFNAHSNGKIPEGSAFAFARGRWTQLSFHCVEKAVDKSEDPGIIVIEGEQFDLHGHWKIVYDKSASGNEYITYFGPNNYEKAVPKETIESQFEIKNPGIYTVKWYTRQTQEAEEGPSSHAWINFPDAVNIGPEPTIGFQKFVGRNAYDFTRNGQLELGGVESSLQVKFDKPGFYTFQISGRSKFLQIDKVILFFQNN